MERARWLGIACLVLAAGCSGEATAPTGTGPPPPATVPSTLATTSTAAVPTTSQPQVVLIPAVGSPPERVDLDSACMQRAEFGDPADSEYMLPFPVGERYRVTQSYCFVPGGHIGQLAVDFAMPIGDIVVAARDGTVVDLRDDSPDDGRGAGEHNYLMIRHPDGTVGFYAHLQQEGLLVGPGDEVEQGQPIAYAGNSGLTGSPHLHFGVYRSWPPREGFDVPLTFRNAAGRLDLLGGLLRGTAYEALPYDQPPEPSPPRPPNAYPGADLAGTELPGAVLWGYDLAAADLSDSDLSGANLSWATLTEASLTGTDLSYADLSRADLRGADLRDAILVGADLSRASLRGCDLLGADLSGAYMAATDLRGTDFSGAILTDVRFIGVDHDDSTVWPEGFGPPPIP
jgi:murein DD-endopeptidase MepM/ murein hydrolase activator NlpD